MKDDAFLRTLTLIESSDSADQVRTLIAQVHGSGAVVASIAVYGRYYKKAKGKVKMIDVASEYQRRGVATWLFAQAQGWWPDLTVQHSTELTDAGKAWKRSLASVRAHLHIGAALDPSRMGQCYNLALKYVQDHEGWVLVHGRIGGPDAILTRADPNPAPPIGHAWAISADNNTVWEPISNDTYPATYFMDLFGADEWVRYTQTEALVQALKTSHWGPWDADYLRAEERWRAAFRAWQQGQGQVTAKVAGAATIYRGLRITSGRGSDIEAAVSAGHYDEAARIIYQLVGSQLGRHWTFSRGSAEKFADKGMGGSPDRFGVVVEAAYQSDQIEYDPQVLERYGVPPFGWWDITEEYEITLKPMAQLTIVAFYLRQNGQEHRIPVSMSAVAKTASHLPYTEDTEAQAYYPAEPDGRVKLYRGVSAWGTGDDQYLRFTNWDELQALLDSENHHHWGVWWGRLDEAMFHGPGVVVGAIFDPAALSHMSDSDGLIVRSGQQGEVVELYLGGQPVSVPPGRMVTAAGGLGAWFHASPAKLEPGDELTPGHAARYKGSHADRVYFSHDPWVAINHVGGPTRIMDEVAYLYEVTPEGAVEDDPEAVAAGKVGQSFMAPAARVVRRLSVQEAYQVCMDDPVSKTAASVYTPDGGWGPFWHGSPSGDLRGGPNGLHVGTKQAATEALCARIGTPVEGTWDGTREYGQTLLCGATTLAQRGGYATGYVYLDGRGGDYYPTGRATYGDGTPIPLTVRPNIIQVMIVGEMANTPAQPYDDFKANGYMSGAIKRGTPRKGYFYSEVGEDSGSIAAVVPPGGAHLRRVGSYIAKVGAALSLENMVSVAENVMAKSGLIGKRITLPEGHEDDPDYQAAIAPIIAWASGIAGRYVKVYTSAYSLRQEGNPNAFITGTGNICAQPTTNELTLLHELAHIVSGVKGHGQQFVRTAHRLYAEHLGAEAAEMFWRLMEPYMEAKTAKTAATPSRLFHAAPKSARDSIAQHGLDWTVGNPDGHAPNGNFFHVTRAAIDDMMSDGLAATHDLYEVNVRGLGLHFEQDPYDPEAIYTPTTIPPERLRRVSCRAEAKTAALGDWGLDQLDLPAQARDGDCIEVSERIAAHLRARGEAAQVVDVWGWGDFMGQRVLAFAHRAVLVGGLIIDATATQFDPTLPPLMVMPRAEYEAKLGQATGTTVEVQGLTKTASSPEDLWHTPAHVVGTPGGNQNVFYNRDTDTLFFTQELAPKGGPSFRNEPGIWGVATGAYFTITDGEIVPGDGTIAPTSQTVYNPLLIEALERLVDTFPQFGRFSLREGTDYASHARIGTLWDFLRSVNDMRAEYATQHTGARSAHDIYLLESPVRAFGAQKLSMSESTDLVRRILGDAGFPHADEAQAVPYPHDPHTSCTAWDHADDIPIPLVALGTEMHDELTVIHECAHLLRNPDSYQQALNNSFPEGYVAHDDQWFDIYLKLMERYASSACFASFELNFGVGYYAPKTAKTASQTRRLWRGLQVADATDEELEAIRRDPAGFARQHLNDPIGIHWTDDPTSAWNFSQGRDPEGWASESDGFDEDEGGIWTIGLVLEGEVAESDIVQPGTAEHDGYAFSDAILDYGIEREVTVRGGTSVRLTSVTVTAVGENGADVDFHAGLGMTVRAKLSGPTIDRAPRSRCASESCSCGTTPGTRSDELPRTCSTSSPNRTVHDQPCLPRQDDRQPVLGGRQSRTDNSDHRELGTPQSYSADEPLGSVVAYRYGTSGGIHLSSEGPGRSALPPSPHHTSCTSAYHQASRIVAWNTNSITLFHGTIGFYADRILRDGLKPRDMAEVQNHWDEKAISHPGLVYLSHESRMTISRLAMAAARKAVTSQLYPIEELEKRQWAIRPDSYSGRGITPEYTALDEQLQAMRAQIAADPRLESVLLAVTIPRDAWGNLEPDEDTINYAHPVSEMTGMPEWMGSLGADAVVAYRGEIPPSWIRVQARAREADTAGVSTPYGDDWRHAASLDFTTSMA